MRKLVWIMLASLPLAAGFFPKTVHTSVASVDAEGITLSKPFPLNGMSGVVIHHYGNTIEAVTGYLMQTTTSGKSKLLGKGVIEHPELPTIKTPVSKGDKVIGGYLYHNMTVLAPDEENYRKVTEQSPNRHWFHPDLLATFLSKEGETFPTPQNLSAFAKEYQIGLIYIIKQDSAVLYDPISQKVIASKPFSHAPKKAKYPFFMRLDKIDGGLFSHDETGNYYKIMEQFK
jgi:hypothetical protein